MTTFYTTRQKRFRFTKMLFELFVEYRKFKGLNGHPKAKLVPYIKNGNALLTKSITFISLLFLAVIQGLNAQTVTSISPAHQSSDVGIDHRIELVFNQVISIDNPQGKIFLFNADEGFSIIHEFEMQDSEVVILGDRLRITPPDPLPRGTLISLRVNPDAINGYDGLFVHSFTTEFCGRPSSNTSLDFIGKTDTSIDIQIEEVGENGNGQLIVFRETFGPATAPPVSGTTYQANTNITLSDETGTGNYVVATHVTEGQILSVTGLSSGTRYSVFTYDYFEDNSEGCIDYLTSGNSIGSITTFEEPAAVISSLTPVDDEQDFEGDFFSQFVKHYNFEIAFDKFVTRTSTFSSIQIFNYDTDVLVSEIVGTAIITAANSNTVSFVRTNTQLEEGEHYYILFDDDTFRSFPDEGQFDVPGISDKDEWDFIISPPEPNFFRGNPDGIDVTPVTSLRADYDRDIQIGTGEIRIRRFDNDAIIRTIDASDPLVSVNPSTSLRVNTDLANPLPLNSQLYVEVDATVVEDLDGNTATAVTKGDWVFTTEFDLDPPVITELIPFDNAGSSPPNGEFIITFDEEVRSTGAKSVVAVFRQSDDKELDVLDLSKPSDATFFENTVTLHTENIPSSEPVYVTVPSDGIEDFQGNVFPGFSDTDTWNFTTFNTPPTIVGYSPVIGAVDVANDAPIILTISEDVQLNGISSTIQIRRLSDFAPLRLIDPTSDEVTISGNIITIQPDGGILSTMDEVEVYVAWSTTPFEDLLGQPLNELFNTDFRFTVNNTLSDTDPPEIATLEPIDNAINISPATDLTITFNEPVQSTGVTRIARLLRKADDVQIETFSLNNPADAVFDGNELTLVRSTNLASGTQFYVTIPSDGIEDLEGNTFAGFTDNETWDFTTVQPTPPQVQVLSPADNATDVSQTTNLTITFNETVQGTGLTSIARIFRSSDDAQIAGFNLNDPTQAVFNGNQLTIVNSTTLPVNTEFYVTLPANGIEDVEGTDFAGFSDSETWNFMTISGDNQAPTLTSFVSPMDNETGVEPDANIVLEFSENVVKAVGNIVVRRNSSIDLETIDINSAQVTIDNKRVTIDPTDPIFHGVPVSISIEAGALEDEAGNPYAGLLFNDLIFFIRDPFTQTIVSPLDGAIDIAVDTDIVMTFDGPIFRTNSTNVGDRIQLINITDNITTTIPANSPEISVNGMVATINPNEDLLPGKEYQIAILDVVDGIFEDEFGFDVGAYSPSLGPPDAIDTNNDNVWSFTTAMEADNTPPSIAVFLPANGSADVDLSTTPSFTFDEDITLIGADVNARIRLFTLSGSNAGSFPAGSSLVTVSGRTVTFNPLGLDAGETYFVNIDEGFVRDLEGNDFEGINDNTTWRFSSVPVTVIWNGVSWNNGTGPDASERAQLNGDYSFSSDGDFECADLIISMGVTLEVDNEGTLAVNGDLTNEGNMIVESGSSLITFEVNDIAGNPIEFRRNSRYADGRYSFVGTPVQQDMDIEGNDLGSLVFQYDETVPFGNDGLARWVNAGDNELVPGRGYAQAFQRELVFMGFPNEGQVTVSGTYTEDVNDADEGWNLISNPYPAAISVEEFLLENTNILGAAYLWDDNNSAAARGTNADYVVVNAIAATQNSQAGNADRYNQHLGASQGFFVKLLDGTNTDLHFTEDMRAIGNNADGNFFRSEVDEIPFMRINLTNHEGLFKQTVLGWRDGLSDSETSRLFDAPVFNGNNADEIYLLKGTEKLSISGVSLEIDTLSLGLQIGEEGNYQIQFDRSDADGLNFYLLDTWTGNVVNTTFETYHFSSQPGSFSDRFKLFTQPSVLQVAHEESQVYVHDNILYVKGKEGSEERTTYQIFDLSGKPLMKLSTEGNIQTSLHMLPAGIYLLTDGQSSQRIMIK